MGKAMLKSATALLLVACVAVSLGVVEEAGVLPMHPIEIGETGVDADVVAKTVKEISFKDAKKGMDSHGNSVDLAANMKQLESNLLSGVHHQANDAASAKAAADTVVPAPKKAGKAEKKSLGEGAKEEKLDFKLPDIKVDFKAAVKKVEVMEMGQEAPARIPIQMAFQLLQLL